MQPNTHSTGQEPGGLDRLAAVVEELAAQDLTRLPDGEAAGRVLVLRRLVDRLEGQWLRELAAVDGRGAAGAEAGTRADSTVGWLRGRLRAGRPQASGWVRVARALYRGSLHGTGRALAAGAISVAHAAVLAAGTADLPPATAAEAEPVLLDTASRVDPRSCGRCSPTSTTLPILTAPTTAPNACMRAAGCGCRPPWRGWWRSTGCWSRRPARRC
jgi:hypothetical protein